MIDREPDPEEWSERFPEGTEMLYRPERRSAGVEVVEVAGKADRDPYGRTVAPIRPGDTARVRRLVPYRPQGEG